MFPFSHALVMQVNAIHSHLGRSYCSAEGGYGFGLGYADPGFQGREEQPQPLGRRANCCGRHSSRSHKRDSEKASPPPALPPLLPPVHK